MIDPVTLYDRERAERKEKAAFWAGIITCLFWAAVLACLVIQTIWRT